MSAKTIFITGGTGFIGSAVVRQAVAQGYHVRALSRNEAADEKLTKAGAVPVRGDLKTFDVLSRESANADIVVYLASAFSAVSGIPYQESMKLTNDAIDVIGAALEGSNKPLVAASGTLITQPDPNGGETTEESPDDPNPWFDRATPSNHALAWAKRGVRVASMRIPPLLYGPGEQISGIVKFLVPTVGGAPIIGGRNIVTSTVHVDDEARLILLAAEKSAPGQVYNGASDTTTTIAQILSAAADVLNVPAKDLTKEEATALIGPMLATYLSQSCRSNSDKAKRLLGWQPQEVSILEYYKNLKEAAQRGESSS
ncbi:NAD(P)-binding protein [Thozetella sp. PMI_491]|nr:NAD(P)-binding protein [Thozetella sp. PMI_491]